MLSGAADDHSQDAERYDKPDTGEGEARQMFARPILMKSQVEPRYSRVPAIRVATSLRSIREARRLVDSAQASTGAVATGGDLLQPACCHATRFATAPVLSHPQPTHR